MPETEEYGIVSFVYRARAPFHPGKIHEFFNEAWPGVIRAKGFFWVSSRPDFVGEVAQAGAFVRHHGIGRWWAAVPKDRWPQEREARNTILKEWDDQYGDRRQEIVFIGLKAEMDEAAIRKRLDDCLIKEYLVAPELWKKVADPFPQWFRTA